MAVVEVVGEKDDQRAHKVEKDDTYTDGDGEGDGEGGGDNTPTQCWSRRPFQHQPPSPSSGLPGCDASGWPVQRASSMPV